MTKDKIKQIIKEHGIEGEAADLAFRVAVEVERETRQEYFALIQNANNAASAQSITARDLNKFVWQSEQKARVENWPKEAKRG